MCGIVGVCWSHGRPASAGAIVDRMANAIRHRGPDSEGRSSTEFADVGFRRLAIIDLSTGDQPLRNEDGSIECFLNGEIYNYQSLRSELLKAGHRLETNSDTEVLPHLYEDHGDRMFTKLNGMFSVCVVDKRNRRVVLARDHFGVKQMYYAAGPAGIVFASEMKGVLAAGLFKPEIDTASILPYLTLFYTPEPHTLVKGVLKLPPGCFLSISGGRAEVQPYYTLPVIPGAKLSDDEAAAGAAEHLARAVKLQLQADVPIGISLSGGLDSSAITCVAAMADGAPKPVALTVSWPNTDPAELACAAELCRRYGLAHEILEPPGGQPLEHLSELAWVADEPIADPALYSQLCVAESASRHVKVLLGGAGGDELFGGYGSYHPTWKRSAFMALPSKIQQMAGMLGAGRLASRDELEAMMAYRDSRFLWHVLGKSSLTQAERQSIQQVLGGTRDPLENLRSLFEAYNSLDPSNQQMVADLRTYLPDQILPMMDRATMARSVEGRVPFLDVPLVEFAFSLPGRTKMGRPRVAKRLLKRAVANLVPDVIVRRTKVGMTSPFPRLIARERAFVRSVLLAKDSYVGSLFPHTAIDALLGTEERAFRNFRVLYGLLILEVWQARFIRDRDYSKPEHATVRRQPRADPSPGRERSAALP